MTSSTRLLARAFLSSLPLIVACSTGKPPSEGDDVGASANGGTSSGTTGNGGNSATGVGGSAANAGGMVGATGGASGASGAAATGGAASSAATGGDTNLGGGAALGGSAGAALLGGSAGTAAAAAMGGMSGTDPGICQHLSAVATPQVPTVEILVDTSSSMWETTPPAWPLLHDALMAMTGGAVSATQDKIRFGFASYKGLAATTSETSPACATMTTVDPNLDNRDAIETAYSAITWNHEKWETPTNYAIGYAVSELQAYNPMPPGPKYILVVTDGNPNTCETVDPQCGQDYAIKAAQDAYAAGIGLFVLGIGSIVSTEDPGCPHSARCGLSHLQDMANAGVGAPVQAPPGCENGVDDPGCDLKYEQCNKNNTLTATYAATAADVGTPFAVDTSATGAQAALTAALGAVLNQAVSCTFELDVIVTGDPALGLVSLSDMPITYNVADGWVLESDSFHVTLQGAACETYRAGAAVSIDFPCDPSGNPIAVHR